MVKRGNAFHSRLRQGDTQAVELQGQFFVRWLLYCDGRFESEYKVNSPSIVGIGSNTWPVLQKLEERTRDVSLHAKLVRCNCKVYKDPQRQSKAGSHAHGSCADDES